ncbi:MAG: hypothetical protein ACREIC_23950 [Limisphaerales bacterium]
MDAKPAMSLEESRALLAQARAGQIERQAGLENGELIDVLWAGIELEKAFGDLPVYLDERKSRFAWSLAQAAGGIFTPGVNLTGELETKVIAALEQEIAAEFKALSIMIGNAKSRMMQTLRRGPAPEKSGRTLLDSLHKEVASVVAGMSPGAQEEFRKALLAAQRGTTDASKAK